MRKLLSIFSFFILFSGLTAMADPAPIPPAPLPPPPPGPVTTPGTPTPPNVCIIVFSGYSTVTSSCDGEPAQQKEVETWKGSAVALTQVESRELSAFYAQGLHLVSCTWLGNDATQCTLAR